jgi:hypothetical protein
MLRGRRFDSAQKLLRECDQIIANAASAQGPALVSLVHDAGVRMARAT